MQLRAVVSNCYDYIDSKQAQGTEVELLWHKDSAARHLLLTDGLQRGKDVLWDETVQ